MKKTLLIISAASLLLAGCAKEQLVDERSYTGPVTVVNATFESLTEDGTTKAAVTDAGTFTWQNGDKAAFAESSSSTSYCFGTNNVAGATTQFAIEGSHTFTNSSLAIYPDDLTTDQVPTTLKVKVPASRVWVNEQTNVAMYGKYETASSSFSFSHMGGLVRVRVKNVPTNAREFVFKASGCKINGEFSVNTVSESKVIETVASDNEDEQTYTLTWTTAPAAENTMDFYIPLPLGTYSGGFAFYLKDEGHNVLYSKVGSTTQSIARKKLLLMPAITLVGGSIEPIEKAAVVANIPAGYSGDFLLPQSEKVLLKINASTEDHNITLKYDGANIPTNLEVKVVDGDNAGNYNAKLLGNLPSTHVEFTQGHIDATELTTSSSTFAVINPATVGTLTVMGGNVLLQGATVNSIVVDAEAKADGDKAPVEIVMKKVGDNAPSVTSGITANADVIVAPKEATIEVQVTPAANVNVATEGEGTVKNGDQEITTKAAAQIGGIKYITLADAIAAIKDGETITMLGNVDKAAGISVPEGKNFTVDFSGFNYAMECPGAGSAATKTAGFQLLKNSTIVFKKGTLKCTDANKDKTWSSGDASKGIAIMIQNYANLTLEDITIDATNIAHNNAAVRYALSNNCGNVEYKGTTTIQTAGNDYAFDVCKYMDYSAPTVTWNSTGTVNGGIELSGGEFILGHNLEVKQPIKVIAPATLDLKTYTLSGSSDFTKQKRGVVIVNRGGELTINGTTGTIDGATNKVYSAVTMTEMEDTGDKVAKLTVNGGTLKGYYYGISGNGNRHNTEINIKGGNILGTCAAPEGNVGIFHPQDGKLTITAGTIEGYSSAVEVRSGTVNISGNCSLKSTATTFSCNPNGSGNTTVGAALAIAQHTTRKAINVTIDGGIFTGYKAISVEDPETGDPQNVNVVINGGTFSDLSGLKYVAESGTYKLANDVNLGENILEINSGKAFSIDLNGKTLTGRTNIKHGNVTFKNGNIAGGNKQALNVYGSATEATNYSVVTVDSDVTVTADVFGVCLFGPTAGANVGYGAGVNIEGTITTTKTTSSNEGAIFVSGNLGDKQEVNTQTAMEGKNFVNISGTVTSASDAALALQGSATATITGKLTGNTGIAAKRGKLIVKENAVITGNGSCVGNPTKNGNGTELTGSAVSASSTYGQRLAIDLQGGTYTSAAYTILNNADDAACSFTISGGKYETTKAGDGIAVYARLGSVNITGGEFINNSNSEATLHVGCPSADLSNGPKLTISGDNTVVKNNASGDYTYGGKPLVVNMANQLTYKAVEISGGKFYYRNPSKDDNVAEPNGNFLKDDFSVSGDETSGWTVVSAKQN